MRIIYEENDYTMSLIQAELDMLESGIYPGFVFFLGGGGIPPKSWGGIPPKSWPKLHIIYYLL